MQHLLYQLPVIKVNTHVFSLSFFWDIIPGVCNFLEMLFVARFICTKKYIALIVVNIVIIRRKWNNITLIILFKVYLNFETQLVVFQLWITINVKIIIVWIWIFQMSKKLFIFQNDIYLVTFIFELNYSINVSYHDIKT